MSNRTQRIKATACVALALRLSLGTADACARTPVRVDEGVYMLPAGAEIDSPERIAPANSAFVVGPKGVAVIDTGLSYKDGLEILAAVRRVTRQPVRLVILTHPVQEAIFGAAAFQASGIPVVMHRDAAALVASRCETCLASLKAALGDDTMAGTRVALPDRLIDGDEAIDAIGRRLRVIAPSWSSAPGAVAVFDERTRTLFAGNLVSIRSVPDTRDADARGWRAALPTLAATGCRHLVPSHGPIGRCADIDAFARYLADLEAHVARLLRQGVTLGELEGRSDMPEYASWSGYAALQRRNASRAYLRLERALFDAP